MQKKKEKDLGLVQQELGQAAICRTEFEEPTANRLTGLYTHDNERKRFKKQHNDQFEANEATWRWRGHTVRSRAKKHQQCSLFIQKAHELPVIMSIMLSSSQSKREVRVHCVWSANFKLANACDDRTN